MRGARAGRPPPQRRKGLIKCRPMTVPLVLLNPYAAGGRAAALRAPVTQWLERHAPNVTLIESDSIALAHATLRALPAETRVIVIGGDGTLHHLLAAALERRHTLALVPLGSGNDSARALGLFGMPWALALPHALHAPAVAIDIGELTTARAQVPFISSLCAGFDAAVCARAVAAPRWLTGRPRYLWSTLCELALLRTWELRVTLDGELRHSGAALLASTCNTPTFGSGMPAVPGAVVADGRLDLLLAGAFGRAGALRMLPRLLAGTHLCDPRVSTRDYAAMHVQSLGPIPLAADGEPLESVEEFEIRVRPLALPVVVGPGRTGLYPAPRPQSR